MNNELEAKILAQASTVVGVNLEAIERATSTQTPGVQPVARSAKTVDANPKRKSKHGNRRTFAYGFWFDSEWESKRWGMLLVKLRNGLISGLQRQVSFKLFGKSGKVISRYRVDFVYIERGVRVLEDAKGHLTTMYKLKRKWILRDYGIAIKETYAKDTSTW